MRWKRLASGERSRGGAAEPGPGSRPASPRVRRRWRPGACRWHRGAPRARMRPSSRRRSAPCRRPGCADAGARRISDRARCPRCSKGAGRRSPRSRCRRRCRGPGSGRGRSRSRLRRSSRLRRQPDARPIVRARPGRGAGVSPGWRPMAAIRSRRRAWRRPGAPHRQAACQDELGIGGDFDVTRLVAGIGDGHAANFGVILRRDDDVDGGGECAVVSHELGAILGEHHVVAVGPRAARLIGRRPHRAARERRGVVGDFQPSGTRPDGYDVMFAEDRAEFIRDDGSVTTTVDVIVSAEDDAEVRRVSMTNSGDRARDIEITSYAELVLAPRRRRRASGLFQAVCGDRILPMSGAILATRRRRGRRRARDLGRAFGGGRRRDVGDVEIETDRARFLGRGRDVRTADRGDRRPAAVEHRRHRARSDFLACAAACASRRARRCASPSGRWWRPHARSCSICIDKHHDATPSSARRRSPGRRRRCSCVTSASMPARRRCSSAWRHVLYADPSLRPSSDTIRRGAARNRACGRRAFRAICRSCCCASTTSKISPSSAQLLQAHEYWRLKRPRRRSGDPERARGVLCAGSADRARNAGADQPVAAAAGTQRGGARLRAARRPDLRGDARAAASPWRASCWWPRAARLPSSSIAYRSRRARRRAGASAPAIASDAAAVAAPRRSRILQRPRRFRRGRPRICDRPRARRSRRRRRGSTSSPIPRFGFQVAAEGGGFTWSVNSRENQLTPWSNDPVSDRPGEAFYLRDEDSGELWSADRAADPRSSGAPILRATATATAGSSTSRTASRSICCNSCRSTDPIKISRLTLPQHFEPRPAPVGHGLCRMGSRHVARRVGAVHRDRDRSRHRRDVRAQSVERGIRRPRRFRRPGADGRRAGPAIAREFLGRNGTLDEPAALGGAAPLSKRVGAGLDPCAALQTTSSSRAGRRDRNRLLPGRRPTSAATRRRRCIARYRAADLDAVARGRRRLLGRRSSARCRSRRPTAPWTSCSTAGCSIRRSPAASGRARRSIRPAAPMASAISCRTAWRSRCRGRT